MTIRNVEEIAENIVRNDVYMNVSCLVFELMGCEKYMDELMEVSSYFPQVAVNDQYRYIIDLDERGEYRASVYPINEDGSDGNRVLCVWGEMFEEGGRLEELCKEDHEGIVDELLPDSKVSSKVIGVDDEPEMTDADDPEEALEHWAVSDHLAGRLEEQGEMVLRDFYGLNIWGRTCSGQAISMDGPILNLARGVNAA